MRIVATSNPGPIDPSEGIAFSVFAPPSSDAIGRVGSSIPAVIRRAGLNADPLAWDFLLIALGVIAADQGCLRAGSPDGWTRRIDLTVAVQDPATWRPHATEIADALKFLTGDIWAINFEGDAPAPPKRSKRRRSGRTVAGDMVCLLSGGMDSLVGGIDFAAAGRRPVLVSQIASGDSERQRTFANAIDCSLTHLQLTHAARPPSPAERSQRARSIIFLAYGLLAATALPRGEGGTAVTLAVPENGLISMNVPLTDLRIGSLSTRTAHPFFLGQMQRIWDAVGFNVELSNPYQFCTKGELLLSCRRQDLLRTMASDSTSCGRFGRYGYEHCGRCIPCLIRRGAFLRWGEPDDTAYHFATLSDQGHFDDVRSLAMACIAVEKYGVERWASGSISFAELENPTPYLETVGRGIAEARNLLVSAGIL